MGCHGTSAERLFETWTYWSPDSVLFIQVLESII